MPGPGRAAGRIARVSLTACLWAALLIIPGHTGLSALPHHNILAAGVIILFGDGLKIIGYGNLLCYEEAFWSTFIMLFMKFCRMVSGC